MSGFISLVFFKQKTAYELRISDWSSDVCSSDLRLPASVKIISEDNLKQSETDFLPILTRIRASKPDALGTYVLDQQASNLMRQYQQFGLSDRKSVVQGQRVSVRVDHGGRRIIKKKSQKSLAHKTIPHHHK